MGGAQGKVYEFGSGFSFGAQARLLSSQHALPQDVVRSGLVTFAPLFQPGDDVGVEAHGDGLLQWPIKPAADCVFPCIGRELRDIGGVDLVVRHGGEGGEFSFLAGSQRVVR